METFLERPDRKTVDDAAFASPRAPVRVPCALAAFGGPSPVDRMGILAPSRRLPRLAGETLGPADAPPLEGEARFVALARLPNGVETPLCFADVGVRALDVGAGRDGGVLAGILFRVGFFGDGSKSLSASSSSGESSALL